MLHRQKGSSTPKAIIVTLIMLQRPSGTDTEVLMPLSSITAASAFPPNLEHRSLYAEQLAARRMVPSPVLLAVRLPPSASETGGSPPPQNAPVSGGAPTPPSPDAFCVVSSRLLGSSSQQPHQSPGRLVATKLTLQATHIFLGPPTAPPFAAISVQLIVPGGSPPEH
ncbi:hypothetical protein IEO21_06984 [Rhodonia placenta]|uniref:Uncharacterized protein n=1 Tax=Rhodonia placenta TaxID=104341 RepID=A0A8H7NYX4_9APHY|nr:hypothetical protein IEO21_06984 [Postia placenta]